MSSSMQCPVNNSVQETANYTTDSELYAVDSIQLQCAHVLCLIRYGVHSKRRKLNLGYLVRTNKGISVLLKVKGIFLREINSGSLDFASFQNEVQLFRSGKEVAYHGRTKQTGKLKLVTLQILRKNTRSARNYAENNAER